MHILIISRSYPNMINKASGNFVRNQVEALASHDIKIGVLGVFNISLLNIKSLKIFKLLGASKYKSKNIAYSFYLYPVIPKLHYINSKIKLSIGKRLLKSYIKENGKPDLIHMHTFEPGELALWAKERFGINFIVTEHTTSFYTGAALDWHKRLAKKVYAESSYNIAVSNASSKDLEDRFNQEFHYLPNFVDTSKFVFRQKEKSETKQFINIAYLDPKKNHSLLINAFDQAFNNNPNYRLKIIGSGPDMNKLKSLIESLGNQNIELLGFIPQEEIIKELQSSDYFVLSSDYETFGVVVIEAMSCGLPVVSTKCGGPESIIINDKLGVLCTIDNVDELAKSLELLSKSSYEPSFITNYANNNFSFEVLSERLISIYKSMIK